MAKPQLAPTGPAPLAMLLGGMLAIFIGERLVGGGTYRMFSLLGALLVLGAIASRTMRFTGSEGDRKLANRILLLLTLVGAAGLALYALQSDLLASMSDKPLDRSSPKLFGVLAILWPALVVACVLPTIFVEVAWRSIARAPKLEVARIRDAAMTGLGLSGAFVFAFSFLYVATQRDAKFDLSYFRTSRPGESSRKIVRALDQPLNISIFYPPGNDVREEVEGYFADLAKESPELKVTTYDNAVDIAKAKELNVTANGMVVVSRGGRKEMLNIGLELEGARNQLRNLDKEVQKRLLQVGRPGRTIYLTTGHGERGFDPANDTDKRMTLRDLREVLQSQSYAVKTIGMADGLGVDLPEDAALVAIIGPQQELLAEEVAALSRYVDRGGRLFVALDPDVRPDPTLPGAPPVMTELLAKLGLKYVPTPLANDQIYAQRTYQKSDRTNIATGGYSSHPSVSSLSRLSARAPMVFFGAGHLEEVKERAAGTTVDFTVRAHGQTFLDANRNFLPDAGEQRKTWELAAAVKRKVDLPKPSDEPAKKDDPAAKKDDPTAKKDDPTAKKDEKKDEKKDKPRQPDELRAIVLSDSDALGDGLLSNPGNAYFFLDGVRWLVGDESIAGEVSSETDVPIAHTRKQDQAWFYSCIFLVPALVIGLGAFMTRRRRMGSRGRAAGPAAPQKEAA